MKGKLRLQQRLILPVILLGLVSLLSNLLAVFSINNVNSNAAAIVDDYMVSEAKLEEIRRSMMDIHRLALSHIVAADHATMIQVVAEIKAEEKALDGRLADYSGFVAEADQETYQALLENYESFKHALVYLVCASADSKTQEAYAQANGDVANWSGAAEEPPGFCWWWPRSALSGFTLLPPFRIRFIPSRTAPSVSAAWSATSGGGWRPPAAVSGASPA